jgi:hypothetical protein
MHTQTATPNQPSTPPPNRPQVPTSCHGLPEEELLPHEAWGDDEVRRDLAGATLRATGGRTSDTLRRPLPARPPSNPICSSLNPAP